MDIGEYAWAAGIVDGEGFFGFYRKASHAKCPSGEVKYGYALLRVGQTGDDGVPEMITRLHKLFGGKIFGPYLYAGRIRAHWLWEVRSGHVEIVYKQLEPWLGGIK